MVNLSSGYSSGWPFILALFATLTLASCQVMDIVSSNLQENYILAAEGGGFAGLEHRYLLSNSGKVYYQLAGKDTLQFLGTLDRRQTAQLFHNADAVQADPKKGTGPGNRYFLLEYRTGTDTMKKVWDPDGDAVPERWRLLHQIIISFGRKFKEKSKS